MRSYVKSEKHDKAEQEPFKEAALIMIKSGKIALEDVANYFPELSEDSVQAMEAAVMQLA